MGFLEVRVVVSGGRTYGYIDTKVQQDVGLLEERLAQYYKVHTELDKLDKNNLVIISGMAKGADSIAAGWAVSNDVTLERYFPDWDNYGKAAGIIRNKEMLENGEPDLIMAFPGGIGTTNMIKIGRACNVEIKEYK